jgi:drug/metabolite transporter (DMT)-like permease
MAWIAFTLFAAFMQSWRNAFQSQLSAHTSAYGVTLARFIWASPLALLYLISLYYWQPVAAPSFTEKGLFFIVGAAIMQIIATALMVKLFQQRNFAVGAGLAKSEALVAAILGVLFFGTTLSLLGGLGVLIGAVAVFVLSSSKASGGLSFKTVMLGLGSGGSFALTSLWIREASLQLSLPFPHRAAWVLLLVISLQTCLLLIYLKLKEPETIPTLFKHSRLTLKISIASCLGSIGWFSAMSLQSVPYVKTLGQVEVFFTLLISVLWLKEKVQIKDALGLVLIALAAIMVMWQ